MPGLTMTDCSVADNVTQARHEYDRCQRAGSSEGFTIWAMKWGASLLEVAAEHAGDEYDDAADLSRDLSDAHDEIEEAEAACKRLRDAMLAAIDKLSEAAA